MVKEVKVTRVFRETEKAVEPVIVNVGGARSSKSYSLCQLFIFKKLLAIRGYKLLVLRKVRHQLKLSTYEMFFDILKENERYSEDLHKRGDLIYRFPERGSIVRFCGMDAMAQVKSTEWSEIWMEEATEFNKKDFLFLKTRLSKGKRVKIYMSLNPEECWIHELEGRRGIKFIYSNYKDNILNLSAEYVRILEGLRDEDETYYQIYTLGQWGAFRNLIYPRYQTVSEFPHSVDYDAYGLDFGYNHPSALVKIGVKEKKLFWEEKLYQTHLTNQDLIEKLKELIPDRNIPIYADCSEPQRIREIREAGFNIFPCKKGKDSVKKRIDFVKSFQLCIVEPSMNLLKERKSYKWQEDSSGDVMDKPVKFRDDCMDAGGYGLEGYKQAIRDTSLVDDEFVFGMRDF